MLPRAYIFIGLNVVRILSLIALVLVFASNIVVVVHDVQAVNSFINAGKNGNGTESLDMTDCDYIEGSTVPNQPAGAFWAVLNRLLIIFQVLVLVLSEVTWPESFFQRFFPVLGPDFGLGPLGIIQALISASILSHHVDDFTLVSAFFLFAISCINMLLGLIFRAGAKPKRSIFAWREHAKGAIPKQVTGVLPTSVQNMTPPSFVSSLFPGGEEKRTSEHSNESSSKAGFGFGRQGEKAAGLKGFLISRPLETLPRYAAPKRNSGSA